MSLLYTLETKVCDDDPSTLRVEVAATATDDESRRQAALEAVLDTLLQANNTHAARLPVITSIVMSWTRERQPTLSTQELIRLFEAVTASRDHNNLRHIQWDLGGCYHALPVTVVTQMLQQQAQLTHWSSWGGYLHL